MVGLYGAGKTTILFKLKRGVVFTSIPNIGFNVETLEYENISFMVWDVGGQTKIGPLWEQYYKGIDAIIYVVDSNDREKMEESRQQLMNMLSNNLLRNVALLVLANKQDLTDALSSSDVIRELGLDSLRNRNWFVQATCATTRSGIYEGLNWLSKNIKR